MRRSVRLSVFALLSCAAGACHPDAPAPGPTESSPAPVASAAASATPVAPARPLDGPLPRGQRPLDLAVYLASAPPADVVAHAQDLARQRFPGIDLHTEPPMGRRPPTALVYVPPAGSLPPPSEQQLAFFGRGLDAAQVHAAAASQGSIVLSFFLDGDPGHATLRKAQVLAGEVATAQGGFVWDEDTRELYSRDEWQKTRIDGWDGDLPDMRRNITVHVYETTGGRHRTTTLGMVKFGLPDLVFDDVPPAQSSAIGWIAEATAQALVEGASPGPGGEIALDATAIRHAGVRARLTGSLGPHGASKGRLTLFTAERQQGDPNNSFAAVRFPTYAGATDAERQAAAVAAIVGVATDRPTGAKGNDAGADGGRK